MTVKTKRYRCLISIVFYISFIFHSIAACQNPRNEKDGQAMAIERKEIIKYNIEIIKADNKKIAK